MKKIYSLIVMLLLLAMPAAMRAQSTTVTIGDPSSSLNYYIMPVNMYYHYSLTQQIYTAEEINMPDGGNITAISFEYTYTQPFSLDGIQVYLKNVSKNGFVSITDMVEVSASDKVYEGAFSATGSGWATITLDAPFHYDGTSNLLVCFYDPTAGYPGSSYRFRCTSTQDDYPSQYLALTYNSDSYIPDLNNIHSFSDGKGLQTTRNNIQIDITPSATGSDIIDFETGDFSQFTFVNDATYPWSIVDATTQFGCDNGSSYCMVSGNAGVGSSTSTIEVSYDFTGDGYIAFDAKCMGEGSNWDICHFYIDGELQFTHGSELTGWNHYTFDVTAGTHTFTWSYTKDSSVDPTGDGFFVDNIEFVLNACSMPLNLTASNEGSNSADLDWTGNGETYTVRYRPNQNIFSDDFENGLGQWTQIDADGDSHFWILGSNHPISFSAHEGSDIVCSQSWIQNVGALTPDNYLVTPQITLGGSVSFWAKAMNENYLNEHFGIAVSTTGNTDASDFTTIAEWTLSAGNWQHYTVDLSAYAGQTGYVALRHFDCTDMFVLGIDEFAISSEPWQTVTTPSANAHLSGLAQNTEYEVQVISDCGSDGLSDWSDRFTFTTTNGSSIGSEIIDFETGDFSQYSFVDDATYPWIIVDASNGCDNGSTYCMKNGNAGVTNSTSTMEATYDFSSDGYISFDAKCMGSGISNFWNYCDFSIDGALQFTHGEDIAGWRPYAFLVTAGVHTFTWSYTKEEIIFIGDPGDHEDILNPEGEGFFVDNIQFGTGEPCVTPVNLAVVPATDGTATVTWENPSSSFILRYRPEGSGSWTTIENITDLSYTITGLAIGSYELQVAASCNPSYMASTSFSITEVLSSAYWYGYAAYSFDGASWEGDYIRFTMQDPTTVSVATAATPDIYAATYANGYVWGLTFYGDLVRAFLNNNTQTISDFETVVSGFESDMAQSMSYNPSDGQIYYIVEGNHMLKILKSFNPANPTSPTEIGSLMIDAQTLAINNAGQGYTIENGTGKLYLLNLIDATTTFVGNTGHGCAYEQGMAFDLTTGELFWAQLSNYDAGLYKVNPTTAETYYIGQIGGGDGAELIGLFMGSNADIACPAPSNLTTSITSHSATLNWTENGEASEWQICFNGDENHLITVNTTSYTFTNLTPETTYTVKVRANCGSDGESYWGGEVSFTTISDIQVLSTANWYAFAYNSFDMESWENTYVNFSIQDPSTLTIANSEFSSVIYAAAYADDYMWYIDYDNGNLGRAIVNNETHTISNLETIVPGFNSNSPRAMSYNPIDGRLYFIENYFVLKSFDPAQPNEVTEIGTIYNYSNYLAINSEGRAFCIGYVNGDLYHLNLTDATTTLVGPTGLESSHAQGLAFDMETGELFWTQCSNYSDNALYLVDTATAETHYLGRIGGGNGGEFSGLFMVGNATSACSAPTNLTVSNVGSNGAGVDWEQPGDGELWKVQYSTNANFSNSSEDFVGGETGWYLYSLEPSTHYYVRVAQVCGSSMSSWSNTVEFTTTGSPCVTPTDLEYSNVSYNGADLTWSQPGDGNDWQIEYSTDPDFTSAEFVSSGATYFPLTGLYPITTYYVRVRQFCGTMAPSAWSNTVHFTTTGGIIIIPDNFDFETGDIISEYPFDNDAEYPWTIVDATNGCDNGSAYCMKSGNAGVHNSTSTIEASHNFSDDGYIAFDAKCMGEYTDYDVCNFSIDGAEQFSIDTAGWNHYSFAVPAGNHTFTWTYSKDISQNPDGDGFFVDNIEFGVGGSASCPVPTNLTVSNIDMHEATLSWNANSQAGSWMVEYSTAADFSNATVETVSTNSIELTGLAGATIYYARVKTACNSGFESDWASCIFNTTFCNTTDQCIINYVLADSYGDGWNGAAINVVDVTTGLILDTWTIGAGNYSASGALLVCDGREVSFQWVNGNYDDETSYTIYDVTENVLFSGSNSMSEPVNYTPDCSLASCPAPTDVSVSVESPYAASMTWHQLGGGSEWHVQYSKDPDFSTVLYDNFVYDNDFWMSNLSVSTTYYVRVANFCGTLGASDWVTTSFTTQDPPCPVPTNLTLSNISDYGADLTWDQPGGGFEWRVYVSPNSNFSTPCPMWAPNETSVSISGLSPATTYYVQVANSCGNSQYSWSEVLTFTTGYTPSCPAPTGLTATDVSIQEATLSWNADNTVDSWEVEYGTSADFSDAVHVTTMTNSLDLTGLATTTTYYARVKASCSNGLESSWASCHFTTSFCTSDYQCLISYELSDAWGDGWNGAAINVVDVSTGTILDSWTIDDGNDYAFGSLSVCKGREIQFQWVSGNFDEETGYTVYDINGEVIFTGSDYYSEPIHYTPNCSDNQCPAPIGLSVSNVSHSDAVATWIQPGEGHEWHIQYSTVPDFSTLIFDDFSSGTSFPMTGLEPLTTYFVRVANFCGTMGASVWVTTSFTTPDSICHAPSNLTVSDITNVGALLDWTENGNADNWQIQITNQDHSQVFYTNAYSKPLLIFDLSPGTNYDVMVGIYCDGDYYWSDVLNFTTTDIPCPVPTDLVVSNVNSCSAEINWTANDDGTQWRIDYSDEAGFDSYTSEYTSGTPFLLSGLNAETTYYVRVRTYCGSTSETISFTTPAKSCPAPSNLTVTNITDNSATLSWTENGSAMEWVIVRDGFYYSDVYENPSTLHYLEPEAEHTVKVKAVCNGCESSDWSDEITFTTASPIPPYFFILGDESICPNETTDLTVHTNMGDNYLWNTGETGETITVPVGTYYVTVTNAHGDEVAYGDFTVLAKDSYEVDDYQSICASELPFVWNSVIFETAGEETVNLQAANGCDSVVTMILTVNTPVNTAITEESCGSYTWEANGETYTESDTYTYEHTDAHGCAQVDTLYLTIHNPVNTATTAEACGSYTWEANGETYTESDTYTYEHQDAHNCTQVDTLYLTIHNPVNTAIAAEACGSYTWADGDGETYTESDTYTYEHTDANGCTQVDTLYLTINPTYSVTEEQIVCPSALPYTWNGVIFEAAGEQTATLEAANGCDSVVTMILSVNDAYEVTETQSVCASELPIVWNGKTFTEAGTQTAELIASNGCDSIVTMVLTVNTPVNTATTAEACGSYTWAANGETYTVSNTYTYEHTDAHGCTQVDTLYLTIYNPVNTAITAEACGSYTWEANGETYTVSDTYTYEHQDAHNCTQVDTLYLTIYNPVNTATTAEACGSYTWEANGETYTESNTYTYEHQDAHNCTQVDTLYLTINNPVNTATTAEACGSYTWEANGETYTVSDTYTYEHQDAHNCTQVDTLYLTIYNPVHTAVTVSECESYTWADGNGETYTESGTHTYEHQDAHGCTQVDTLHLTILLPTEGSDEQTICSSELPYEWNGVIFEAAGEQTATLEAANGCDSVVTMTLHVNPTYIIPVEAAICNGDAYNFYGQLLTAGGEYTHPMQTVNGCDSVEVLTLTVNPTYSVTEERTVCSGALPYTWNGVLFGGPATKFAALQSVNGCDSLVTMTLLVSEAFEITETRSVCASELPIVWNGKTFTEAGTQTAQLVAGNGCDSIVTMVLTVNTPVNIATTIGSCGSYTWEANGEIYTESNTYTYEHTDANGCTQVDTLYLTIYNPINTAITEAACGSYTWTEGDGLTYTESGTYYYEHQDAHNCTQVDTLYLTIYNPINTAITEAVCGSYTWTEGDGVTFTESGTYYYEHLDAHGCTQVDTLYLTIYTPVNTAITEAVCGSYTWTDGDGVTYTESGIYYYEHQDAHGCTQVDTLYLTIHNPVNTAITEESCGSYTWAANGETYTESDTYTYEHQDAHGCTQVDTLYLTIYNPVNTATTAEACGSFTWVADGETYTESDTYLYEHEDAHGCTQVDTLYLTIHNPVAEVVETSACGNYTWAANGQTYYVSGEYTYSHQDVHSCTQVDTLRLTILQGSSAVVANTICASELPYEWNGVTFTAAGMQTATLTAVNGCDSVVTMVLTVNAPPVNTAITATECGSYTWAANGQTYYESGEYTYAHQDINGCTQVDTLHLTIYNPVAEVVETSECGSYTWAANGQTYYESGEYTYAHTDAHGCTQVDTLRLTIYNPVDELVEATECGSYTWATNGQTYYESGEYTYTHTDAHGCTQVDTLRLTINNPVAELVETTACGSYTWAANGQTYAVSGEYTYAHTDAHGCTQVDTLRLTILQGSSAVLTSTICASELPYVWNGVTFTEAGMQTTTLTAVNGCDSVVTMVLTVNAPPVNTAITATECGSYTWAANGQTYYESGVYTYSHPDVNGCTQVDTLYLTINHPVNTAITATECGSYTWNGQNYTTSGVYTYSHTDANGCTQVDTLYLTISQSVQVELYETACGSYTWNGQTYTQSNDYSATFTAANGCDSIVVLHLTINNPVNTAITVEECDSYTWTTGNGQTYTTSGDYTYSHVDDNGCTQVDTLHLTIHYATTSEFTIETPDSCYTWNGQSYCASGDYVQTLQTVNGCDSVVTLHLTTSVGVSDHEVTTVFLAPNPTQNICRIMGLETDPVSVDLYDMRGKLVMKASGRELDVTTLPTGLYMVKVFTGDRFINLKLVKQ